MKRFTELDAIDKQLKALRSQEESIQNQIADLEKKHERLKNLSIFYKLHYL